MLSAAQNLQASEKENVRVFIAGNPNSGKTTVFNALTGLRYKVGNYPGVTVERKEGSLDLSDSINCRISDLPGIYTLSGESIDEQVAAQALDEAPDVVIAVVDASNIERNLFIVSELLDLQIPLILALNMTDVAEKRGIKIQSSILSRALDVPVIKLSAAKKQGVSELKQELRSFVNAPVISSKAYAWGTQQPELVQQLKQVDRDSRSPAEYGQVATARYKWINEIVRRCVTHSPSYSKSTAKVVDAIATHQVWGLFIFVAVMAVIFQSIFSWATVPMDVIDWGVGQLGELIAASMSPGPLRSLLIDGVLAGVGSVLVFIPQIALLFFFIGILEDSGYLCRAAFVMDRVMRKVGLQGRSFIPLLSSFACAVPGIMSTRSIPSMADRLITILVSPLMSCSARLPVYAVLIAAFIPQTTVGGLFSLQGLIMLGLYALGVITAAVVALVLKLTMFSGEPALFVMEMPPFRLPSLKLVLRDVYDRVVVFVRSAGTVILACSIVLWFLASHPTIDSAPPSVEASYAGSLGKMIEPIIEPLGFDWRIGVGLLASFAAREVFVSSLATVYNLESENEATESLTLLLKESADSGVGFGLPAALALLVFYVYACQCMSTLAVCRRETGGWKWPAVMFLYMTILAYVGAFLTYQICIRVL